MSDSQPILRVGAKGWQFDHWQGSFYPDDLPEEWRFSYYSNEFNSVLVPAEYLVHYSLDDWVDWADDTSEDFGFYIELLSDFSWKGIAEKIDTLTTQLKGFVISLKGNVDLQDVTKLIKVASHTAPVSIQRSGQCSVNAKALKSFRYEQKLNAVWDNPTQDPDWGNYGGAIIVRDQQPDDSPLAIREQLEKGIEHAGDHSDVAFFLSGIPPRIELLRNARVISELIV